MIHWDEVIPAVFFGFCVAIFAMLFIITSTDLTYTHIDNCGEVHGNALD